MDGWEGKVSRWVGGWVGELNSGETGGYQSSTLPFGYFLSSYLTFSTEANTDEKRPHRPPPHSPPPRPPNPAFTKPQF